MRDDSPNVLLIIVATLALIMIAVVFVMMIGLFDTRVDNKEVFAIIGPAFHMITGIFVGVLTSRFMDHRNTRR